MTMTITATTKDAYHLLHAGVQALARVEQNGICVDVDYLDKAITKINTDIALLERDLKADAIYKLWHREFGMKTKLGSREQLAHVLFTVLKHPCKARTATGRPKADEAAFEDMDVPFVKQFIKVEKLKKARGTYLEGIKRELCGDRIHPFYHLHSTRTYRSSSSENNFQNIPVRNALMSDIIRRCYIPSEGRYLVEIDFSGIEVKIAYCCHKDPVMYTYLTDPRNDMHRDVAAQLLLTTPDQINKVSRHIAKNKFVFPVFYGDYYASMAPNIWAALRRQAVRLGAAADGPLVLTHLRKMGITELGACDPERPPRPGTFEKHVKDIEDDFWGNRFKVYGRWKRDFYDAYKRRGYFDTYTGFRIAGLLRRNEVTNFPVQGPAYHCQLWSQIEIQRRLDERAMKTLIVGSIHDSLLFDVPEAELDTLLNLAVRVMTKLLPKAWQWISVPLDVEVDVSVPGTSWFDKKVWVPDAAGPWGPKDKKAA